MTAVRTVRASGEIALGDLHVWRLGFGAMQLTGPGIWGPPRDRDQCLAVLRRALELDVNFIDTADSYGPHVSEELIRDALHPYPEGLVIGTKAGYVRTGPDEWFHVGRPEYLRQQCEMSLRRLGVDCIDLYQLHRVDSQVPAAEQFGLMAQLVEEGKVRHVGLSEVGVEAIREASTIVPIVSVQNQYNLLNRQSSDVLRLCEQERIAFIPWFPMAAGDLAKPGGPVDGLARELGAGPSQVALAWLLGSSPVSLPIPGTSSVAHLEENCGAADLELSKQQIADLSALAGEPSVE